MSCIVVILLACEHTNEKEMQLNWGEYSDAARQRLKNNIDYEVIDGVIYIQKKDLFR